MVMLAAGYDPPVRALVPLVAGLFAGLAVVVAPGVAAPPKPGAFKTPSGNIVCAYIVTSNADTSSVQCGIKSGLRPAPRNTCTDLDYSGKRVSLRATGRSVPVVCAGDPGAFLYEKQARVLPYGSSWHGGGLRCTSRRTGMTCTNRSGHGFFLSRQHQRIF
jgi:hypothetical protein